MATSYSPFIERNQPTAILTSTCLLDKHTPNTHQENKRKTIMEKNGGLTLTVM